MILETELKLTIDSADIEKLPKHPFIKKHSLGVPAIFRLHTIYFDTADFMLLNKEYVLRVRDRNGIYIQTIKDSSRGEKGLHSRYEWQNEVSELKPDISKISDHQLRQFLLDLQIEEKLRPIFFTDMQRTQWQLEIDPNAKIELALDEGVVCADTLCETIREVELELQQGDVQVLFDIAKELQKTIKLSEESQSKAERGYRLAKQIRDA